ASSVTEVGFSERFKSIFILKDMIPHIKNRVSKSPLDFLDTLSILLPARMLFFMITGELRFFIETVRSPWAAQGNFDAAGMSACTVSMLRA
ncbi:hypothetical protein, partial [Paenibacillus cookii]|uniref:hypothetical protein n=1 Tax=Paenibacillus cookii TaxID=157839 RepID=UPI001BB41F0E